MVKQNGNSIQVQRKGIYMLKIFRVRKSVQNMQMQAS
jgi:hypothetical protein